MHGEELLNAVEYGDLGLQTI